MFPEVDPLLGPEMRSTGEVLGMADSFGLAFYKAQIAAKTLLPLEGTVLMTVCQRDRKGLVEVAKQFAERNKEKLSLQYAKLAARLLNLSLRPKRLQDLEEIKKALAKLKGLERAPGIG
jgi:hypothetical protein